MRTGLLALLTFMLSYMRAFSKAAFFPTAHPLGTTLDCFYPMIHELGNSVVGVEQLYNAF